MLRPRATRTAATRAAGSWLLGASSESVSQMVRRLRIGTRSSSRHCSTLTSTLIGRSLGTRSSTSFGALFPSRFSSCCTLFMAEKFMRVRLQQMAQVGGDDGTGVHHRVAQALRLIAPRLLDPNRVQTERRVLGRRARHGAGDLPRIDGQLAVGEHLGLSDRRSQNGDAIGIRAQLQVVANVHGLDQKAEFLGQLLAYALDAPHQFAALIAIHQRNQPVTHLEADQVDGLDVIPGQFLLLRWDRRSSG